jgi:hypothetical protein
MSGNWPERSSGRFDAAMLSGFLKSRVYAKLLMPLISERYQTFTRQPAEIGTRGA